MDVGRGDPSGRHPRSGGPGHRVPAAGRDRSALCMGSPDVTWVTGQRFSTVGARYTLRNRRSFATLMCGSSSDLILY